MEYNLYFPGDAGVEEASYQQTVDSLQKKPNSKRRKKKDKVDVSLQELPRVPKELTYKETLGFHEGKQVQLKQFESETILRNHGQRLSISKHISTFANARGGVILLGVTNDGQRAKRTLRREWNQFSIICASLSTLKEKSIGM